MKKKTMMAADQQKLFKILQVRFEENMNRHKGISWKDVAARLKLKKNSWPALWAMEETGGEPDVLSFDKKSGAYVFCDCSAETPAGRRSLCFDQQALDARKANKPKGAALELAKEMGVQILSESAYRDLQKLGEFDLRTSSWIATPEAVRSKGGALFCDRRYDQVFTYHNGADSYYAARGFRAELKV